MISSVVSAEAERRVSLSEKKQNPTSVGFCFKELAATYSRGSYTTTTIGKTVFDGRVRDGIGSDHSFMATKKLQRTFIVL